VKNTILRQLMAFYLISTSSLYACSSPLHGDLPNFHAVHSYLLRGGEPTETGLKELKEMGVSTIIDLRAPTEMAITEKKFAKELGMQYINLPMSSKPPTKEQVETLEQTIDAAAAQAKGRGPETFEKPNDTQDALRKPGSYPGAVYVHCAHGSDRTGCMVGIWRVKHDGYSYDEAYKEMRSYYFTPKYTELSAAVKERAKK
jgi:protein tyrosine/serine phosphatase